MDSSNPAIRLYRLAAALSVSVATMTGCGSPDQKKYDEKFRLASNRSFYAMYHARHGEWPRSTYPMAQPREQVEIDYFKKRCEGIPRDMLGRSATYPVAIFSKQAYYRSECFLGLAVWSRQRQLCTEVVRAWTLHPIAKSSHVSASACRKEVDKAQEKDGRFHEYLASINDLYPHVPTDILVEPIGGVNFRVTVNSSGTLAGSYYLYVDIVPLDGYFTSTTGRLSPWETELEAGEAVSTYYFKPPPLYHDRVRKGFKVMATIYGPVEVNGEDTAGIFSLIRELGINGVPHSLKTEAIIPDEDGGFPVVSVHSTT